jgi:ribokinase
MSYQPAPHPSFDVVVCGSLHLDIVVRAQQLPRIDETAVGTTWEHVCGGKGGNQAVQAAKAGAATAMISCIGQDAFGPMLLANLKASGVNSDAVTMDPQAGSGMSVAILQDDGDYGAVIVSGANLKIDPAAMSAEWNRLGGARVLVLQNEVPHLVNVAIAKAAKADGATVVFNAAPARQVAADLMSMVDILVVNRVEAEAMSGLLVDDRASAIAAMPVLRKFAKALVVTLGGQGLVVSSGVSDAGVEIEAQVVKVISSHGAGDCFVGTLAERLSKGVSLVDACRAANVRAAKFVSRH